MRFQRATQKHLDAIMNVTNEAKAQLKRMEIDQWQKGYPSREVWEEDLKQGRAYIALDESTDAVMGAFSFFTSQDPSYKQIDGAWLTGDSIEDGSYASLHRVCVAENYKGQGVVGRMFDFAFDLTRSFGITSVRIDTHPDNKPMMRSLSKAGFLECGFIRLVGGVEDGNIRIAFEKVL